METRAVCICAIISNLIYCSFGIEVNAAFRASNICNANYGNMLNVITSEGVAWPLWCATVCTERPDCASAIYDQFNQVCTLYSRSIDNPQTSGCAFVTYIEKQRCVVGNSCTYPLLNTRLCDGVTPGQCHESRGRLEVFVNNQWGTVCDDYWRDEHSMTYPNEKVTCRMYGYSNGQRFLRAYYGPGTGPIHRDDVMCLGHESSILHCTHNHGSMFNCYHNEDVGVLCY